MSLLFSKITLRRQDGKDIILYESGHPDEYDMWELLKYEGRYASLRTVGLNGLTVQVQHYRFLGGSKREWLAEREHIALMEAYDEMAPDVLFTQRDDVEHLEYYEFQM